MPVHSTHTTLLPPRPKLVFRAGFAGRQSLSETEHAHLQEGLTFAYGVIGHRLAAITPDIPVEAGNEPRIASFLQPTCPLLRLITGLCEGSDTVAAQVLETVQIHSDQDNTSGCLTTELAAILPFDIESYRQSRTTAFLPEFERQLQKCAWIMELDGIYDKPDPDTLLAKIRRARAYRAQGAFLLRQSDILIAAANPDEPGKAGGTLETVQAALAFDLPVLFIHTGTGKLYPIEPEQNFHSILSFPPLDRDAVTSKLKAWVTQITADPDTKLNLQDHPESEEARQGESLLKDFFENSALPPSSPSGERRITFREWIWTKFHRWFKRGPSTKSDPTLEPFSSYRNRARLLNYHYSGHYRGAILLNYLLAIVAVLLAALGLTLLGTSGHTPLGRDLLSALELSGHASSNTLVQSKPATWLLPVLLSLTLGKFSILCFIIRNTSKANKEGWNDRAVDLRYLAERLRTMLYLPLLGSHQPPAAAPPQFASRVVRQSTVDWLFDSIVRSISPADLSCARSKSLPSHDGSQHLELNKVITIHPETGLEQVRDAWVLEQAKYHAANSLTMKHLNYFFEQASRKVSFTVISIVFVDLVLIFLKLFHFLPAGTEGVARTLTLWLIFIATVGPAVIAAVGGIRFQSECQRLKERSSVMCRILAGPDLLSEKTNPGTESPILAGRWQMVDDLHQHIVAAKSDSATDLGSWSLDALLVSERIASDFVQEVAEWSVLYAKEVPEPG